MQPITGLLAATAFLSFCSPGLASEDLIHPRERIDHLKSCPDRSDFHSDYDVAQVMDNAIERASKVHEYGMITQALLELHNPENTVFDPNGVLGGKLPQSEDEYALDSYLYPSLEAAKTHIDLGYNTLAPADDGHTGTPATLGIAAVQLSQMDGEYMAAARAQANHLLQGVPRLPDGGAISSTDGAEEAWAEWVFQAPPFLAYYAVASDNATMLKETIAQIGHYRYWLLDQEHDTRLWKHVHSEGSNADAGRWSLGNAYAAAGMVRVLATVMHWETSAGWKTEIAKLKGWIWETMEDVMTYAQLDERGHIKNYMIEGFGETSGTALMGSAMLRLMGLAPELFGAYETNWALNRYESIVGSTYVDSDHTYSIIEPSVNPNDSRDRIPIGNGTSIGSSAGGLLYAAYRDYVCAQRGA